MQEMTEFLRQLDKARICDFELILFILTDQAINYAWGKYS